LFSYILYNFRPKRAKIKVLKLGVFFFEKSPSFVQNTPPNF